MAKGWQELYINGRLFCNHYFSGRDAMNIIVTHTPIVSTLEMQPAYEPLTKYGVNIFVFDFYETGQSKGSQREFSRQSIVLDLEAVVNYIENNFSSNIHLYGNTGIGGMMAQYYAATIQRI